MVNAILAAILSFFIPGLGQVLDGKLQRGIILFVGSVVLLGIIHILFRDWIFHIVDIFYSCYAAYDAYQLAKY